MTSRTTPIELCQATRSKGQVCNVRVTPYDHNPEGGEVHVDLEWDCDIGGEYQVTSLQMPLSPAEALEFGHALITAATDLAGGDS